MDRLSFIFRSKGMSVLYASLILTGSLLLTIAASAYIGNSAREAAGNEFRLNCSDLATKINDRLNAQAQLLRCGAALFASSDSISRKQWEIFYRESNIDKNLPGILGLGYTMVVAKKELQRHIKSVRNEGYPTYNVTPDSPGDFVTSIIYIEPFEGRNIRAFGFNMYSEAARRQAMDQACDSNRATLTGKVTLVQETLEDVQAGTLMYVPVYRNGIPVSTVGERRAAIKGWVYSPYRMNDLMDGVLGRRDILKKGEVGLKIYDGGSVSSEALMYDSQRRDTLSLDPARTLLIPLDYHGTRWTLLFSQYTKPVPFFENRAYLVFGTGLVISFLLFILFLTMLNTRYRAQIIADELTAEIKRASARLTLAARAGGVGIWSYDLVNGKLYWDDQMYALYGIKREDFSSAYAAWSGSLHPDDVISQNEQIQMAIRGEKDFDSEFRVIWPDRSVHNVRGQAVVLHDEAGRPLEMLGTNWDITEQKRNEEALINAKEDADSANRAKSEFLLNISHEFRTPLNAIIGYTDFITSKIGDQAIQEHLRSIKSSGFALLDLINDILEMIRLEKGKTDFEPSYIETYPFFRELERSFHSRISEKGLSYVTDIPPGMPNTVFLDGIRLRQIISNLIGNAVKFTREGSIIVRVMIEDLHKSGSSYAAMLVISVSDTGSGIPEEIRDKIFEPFFQAQKKTVLSGAGIGLTITRRLVRDMGGSIEVISEAGKGSTFVVRIPDVICYFSESRDGHMLSFEEWKAGEISDDRDHPIVDMGGEIHDLPGLIAELEGRLNDTRLSFDTRQPINEVKKFGQDLVEAGSRHKCSLISRYGEDMVTAAANFDIERMLSLIKEYRTRIESLRNIRT